MNIGIMGGTFDPVHNGHLMLAEEAQSQHNLERILFLPNGHPPHKEETSIESAVEDRIHMLKLAILSHPSFTLELYEAKKPGVSFSADTLEYLAGLYPEDKLYFIIGGDSLLQLKTWYHPERILKYCTILATYRDELDTREEMDRQISYLNKKYRGEILLFETPVYPVSSSEIRRKIRNGLPVSGLLPDQVEAYIREKSLYGGKPV